MQARVKWVDDAMFLAESGSGHSLAMDGPETHGGRNLAPRPMEMILMGVGGCAAFDVVSILRKARQPIADCRVELSAKRADAVPSPFTEIHMHFVVCGQGVARKQVERAVSLSAEKYCSASIMLKAAGVAVTHSFELEE